MGQDDVNIKYLAQYIVETEQNIESFNDLLLTFEKEKSKVSLINDLFRVIHTIKGTSGIVNVSNVQKVAYQMESILSFIRETKQSPDDTAISLLFSGIDAIHEIILLLKGNKEHAINVDDLCLELEKYYQTLTTQKNAAVAPVQDAVVSPASQKETPVTDSVDLENVPEQIKDVIKEALSQDLDLFKIIMSIEEKPPMRSMKALLVKERLLRYGVVVYLTPSIELIDDTTMAASPFGLIFCGCINEKDIRSAVSVSGVKIVSIERVDHDRAKRRLQEENLPKKEFCVTINSQPDVGNLGEVENMEQANNVANPRQSMELSTIRIDSNKLDNLMNLSGELVIVRARFAQLVSQFNAFTTHQREFVQTMHELSTTHELLQHETRTCFASVNKMDRDTASKKMVKINNELSSVLHSMQERLTKSSLSVLVHSLDEVTTALGKISSDIQSGVMQARMVPVEGVFTRFKRIVRDLSKELGKEVVLEVEGEETELDKKIVDSLGDPLTHLIRNAIDHGIEDKETRKRLGKPEVGIIRLRASHKGSHIWIEVIDDGRGIEIEKIVQVALKKKILDKVQIDKMTEKDKIGLIFLPGFSTAERVTDLSGRGVGMDVVKNMITSVNGIVDIDTAVGKGSVFILKIPLTLAIIQALLVMIGEVTYAFPLESVIEIVKVSKEEVYSIDGVDTVKLREHTLNLVELEKTIYVQGKSRKDQSYKTVVIITDGESKLGIVIDSLIGEDEIVIKSLSEHFSRVVGVTGASILGDGTIALILDPLSIIKEAR